MRGHWIVRLPSWLGDTVMAVPTIRALVRAADRVTLWGAEQHGRLLQATGVRVDVLPFSRRRGVAAPTDIFRAARRLAALQPDGALLLPNAFEPALTAALARVRHRVGYATDARGWLLTDPVAPPSVLDPVHESDRFAALLEPLRVARPRSEDTLLEVSREMADRGRRLLAGVTDPVAIVPGCANGPAKRWPAARFAELAQAIAERWQATPILLGGPQDTAVVSQVQADTRARCVNLAGRTSLLDLAAILAVCRCTVSNDTGSAHLAAALGCPTLVVFGPTDPRRTRARGPHVRIASIGAFCQPCMTLVCPLDHRCLQGLATELVLSSLEPLWQLGKGIVAS